MTDQSLRRVGEKNGHRHGQRQLCGDSGSHTFKHPHSANTPKNLHPPLSPHPCHRSSPSFAVSTSVGWRVGARRARRLVSQDGGGVTVSVSWLRDGHEVPVQADQAMERFWSVSSDQVGGFESLQGRGRKLPHTSLGQERALDGLQLWRGLGVLQGRVSGCHRTLRRHAKGSRFIT